MRLHPAQPRLAAKILPAKIIKTKNGSLLKPARPRTALLSNPDRVRRLHVDGEIRASEFFEIGMTCRGDGMRSELADRRLCGLRITACRTARGELGMPCFVSPTWRCPGVWSQPPFPRQSWS